MYINDILGVIDGVFIKNKKNNKISKIKTDSRTLRDGDLFICLKGNKDDGHKYIENINVKLSGIIVEKNVNVKTKIPIIKVNNTYDTLIKLAYYIRSKHDIPYIAITGSVGKTTTKELIYSILKNKYKVLKNEKNLNNHIGVPQTLFNLDETYDIAVLEMGMNHLNEIKKLSDLVKPNISLITNIGSSHIGILGSKENIFKAKLEIISGMDRGTLIINNDDLYLKRIEKFNNIDIIKCGTDKCDDLYAYKIKCLKDRSLFSIKINSKEYKVEFNIPGKHLISDVLLAIKCGLLYNIDINDIINSIRNFNNVEQRMEVIPIKGNNILIKDCYNSSYESIMGVLDVIKKYNQKKLIILGDILEIGSFNDEIYKNISKKLVTIRNKEVITVGINKIGKYKNFNNVDELNVYLNTIEIKDSVILLKGSRGIHLDKVNLIKYL